MKQYCLPLLLLLLGGMMMCSCVTDLNDDNDKIENMLINFIPENNAYNISRAKPTSVSDIVGNYNVSCSVYPDTKDYKSVGCGNYFYNQAIDKSGKTNYYWPAKGNKIAFFAYYPNNTETVKIGGNNSYTPIYSYEATEWNKSVDFMTADTVDILTPPDNKTISLNFKHRMAKVQFVIKNTSKFEFASIIGNISSLKNKGQWTDNAWKIDDSSQKNIVFKEVNNLMANETQALKDIKDTDCFYILPQVLNDDSQLNISAIFKNGVAKNYTYHFNRTEFVMGKAYTITINLSAEEVIVDMNTEIEDWKLMPDYMKFVALEDAQFSLDKSRSANITYLAYSIDNGKTWVKETGSLYYWELTTPVVKKGNAILWKGKGNAFNGSSFSATGKFSAKGNVMSLLYGEEDFEQKTEFNNSYNSYVFYCLFKKNTNLVDAGELKLPATTLASSCYSYMFEECTALTKAPELPATTLADACYENMFSGCTALTKAPELPATTLADKCYSDMFNRCTSLTKAPELPATTLANLCYSGMFRGCTSLTKAPELPATTLANLCYQSMFNRCTSLTQAPELPATTLAWDCYRYMFNRCSSLSSVTMLAPSDQITSKEDCCYGWLDDAGTKATSRTLKIQDKAAYDALEAKADYLPAIWQTGKCTVIFAE